MKKRMYAVVLYFAGFYLMYFFYFARFCSACWNIRFYDPHLAGFLVGIVSTYGVFRVLHGDMLRLERYKKS